MKTKYKIDLGRKIVHFSAVGSGYKIWKTIATCGSKDYDKNILKTPNLRIVFYVVAFYQ